MVGHAAAAATAARPGPSSTLYDADGRVVGQRRAPLDRRRPGGVRLTCADGDRAPGALVARRRLLPGLRAQLRRLRRRRPRRPARHHRRGCRYLRDLGVDARLDHAVLPLAPARRGLRRRRLHRRRPAVRRARRRRRAADPGATTSGSRSSSTWCPTTRRPSTPWFQAALAAGPGQPGARALPVPDGQGPRRRAAARTTGSRSSAARGVGPRRSARRRVVPPPLRHDPARPRLAQPRGAGDVRGRAAVLARPRRRRLPRRRRARPVQGEEPARPARRRRRPAPTCPATARSARWSSAPRATSRCGTSPRCTTSTARWHRILAEYDGDRMAVAEAWTQTPESMARYVRPDELHQAFNFAWLLAPWSARGVRRRHPRDPRSRRRRSAPRRPGCFATTTSSGTPPGTAAAPVGLARARAATLAMLALPGSAYLYQGEELGLEEVDVPPEHRQDPAWFRTGTAGPRRRPGADPVARDALAVRLRPGADEHLAADARRLGGPAPSPRSARTPARRGRSTARRCGRDAGSPDSERRRRAGRAAARPCSSSVAGALTVRVQLRPAPGAAARGRGRARERTPRRRPAAARHRGLADLTPARGRFPGRGRCCSAPRPVDEVAEVGLGPLAEPLVEPAPAVAVDGLQPVYGVGAGRDQHRPAVVGVGLAHEQPEVAQVLHLAADRALVDAEPLRDHRGALRALGREEGEHQVRRGLQVGVNRPGPLADHALHAPDQDAELLLETAQLLSARHGVATYASRCP